MTNDIVTRLREHDCHGKGLCEHIISEAANEIERLRRVNDKFADDVKTWRKLALAEHWSRVPDHLACDCLDKAVRGDV